MDCYGGSNAGDFTGGRGSGNGPSDGPTQEEILTEENGGGFTPPIIEPLEIINELTGKAKCIYDKLNQNGTSFAEVIKKFDGEFPVSHLRFSMADLANTTRGRTLPPKNYMIEIQLNNDQSNSGVSYRPNLLIAKTIIHEVIHAEMFRKMISLASSNGEIDVNKLNRMLQNGDYPGMLDYYTRYGVNGFQHQQMAAHYRETIADMLQTFDNYAHSRQFYLDLAWEGLNHSNITAWQNVISEVEQDRIDTVISEYISNNKNENCN